MNEYKMTPERQQLCNEIREEMNRADKSAVQGIADLIESKVEDNQVWNNRLYWATVAVLTILSIIF